MHPTLTPETETVEEVSVKTCINCGSTDVLSDVPNALCADCRQSFIKYPFPLWIKAFGIGIAVVVLFSLFSFFESLQTGIHLERGLRAEKDHRYQSAQHEFEYVLKKVPNHVEAKAHLLMSSFYNNDMATFAAMANKLEGDKFEDNELFANAERVFSEATLHYPSDSLTAVYQQVKDLPEDKKANAVEAYANQHPLEVLAAVQAASYYVDEKMFGKADSILLGVLERQPLYSPALTTLVASKRYQKDFTSAQRYIDELLAINKENVYAISSKARIMLMMHKDEEAVRLAEQAYQIDKDDGFNTATRALAYHYSKKIKERDAIVQQAQSGKDSSIMYYMSYAIDVINKEKLRD